MKFKYLFILVVFMVGVPNYFVRYDVTALTHHQGIDINQILRVLLYGILIYFTVILTLNKQILSKKYFSTIKTPFLYYLFYAVLFVFGNHLGIFKAYYRIIEWFGLFLLVYYIQLFQNKFFTIDDFIKVIKILVWYSIILVTIGLIFKYNMTYICSDKLNLCRLGGYVIGPNSLGVIAGFGISYYLFIAKRYKKFFILLFLIILYLTYSRGAIFGFLISLLPLLVIKNRYRKIFLLFFVIGVIIFILNIDLIISYLSRGQGIENLITLSERYYVFIAAIDLIKQHFLTGVGFVTGTKVISDIMQNVEGIEHWTNVHAHNEFLQSLASGGIIMFLFDMYIFIRIFLNILKITNEKIKLFILSIYLQLLIFSFLMVTISFPVSIFNVLIWLLYIATNNIKVQYVKNIYK